MVNVWLAAFAQVGSEAEADAFTETCATEEGTAEVRRVCCEEDRVEEGGAHHEVLLAPEFVGFELRLGLDCADVFVAGAVSCQRGVVVVVDPERVGVGRCWGEEEFLHEFWGVVDCLEPGFVD